MCKKFDFGNLLESLSSARGGLGTRKYCVPPETSFCHSNFCPGHALEAWRLGVRRGSVLFCSISTVVRTSQVDAYLNTDFSTDPRDHT